jgi:hypothetical protein
MNWKIFKMLRIVEIETAMIQGATKPVLCRAENGEHYIVKGTGCAKQGLIAEWIAANLAKELALPIPHFSLMKLDSNLVNFSTSTCAQSLKGILFGSRRIDTTTELRLGDVQAIDETLKARILLFDWWIANADRQDSNPNMLWVAGEEKLWIIDHNLAFDPEVLPPSKAVDFWNYHSFRNSKSLWSEQFRNEMRVQMRNAVEKLNGVWESLPQDWTEAAELSAGITFAVVREWLIRFETQSAIFWGTP